MYRYPPEHGEGAFGLCSFWAVEAQAHGGDVAFEVREGGGSCFVLKLPLKPGNVKM